MYNSNRTAATTVQTSEYFYRHQTLSFVFRISSPPSYVPIRIWFYRVFGIVVPVVSDVFYARRHTFGVGTIGI